jgi:hypothetical protein
MLGWFFPRHDGALDLFTDEDEAGDPAIRCRPSIAQGPRTDVQIDDATFPGIEWHGVQLVLGIVEDGQVRILHELPPVPRIGDAKADKEAVRLHGALVSLNEYWAWLKEHGEENL